MSADREPSTEAGRLPREAEVDALIVAVHSDNPATILDAIAAYAKSVRAEVRSDLARQVAAEIDTGDASVAELAYRRGLRRALALLAGTDPRYEPCADCGIVRGVHDTTDHPFVVVGTDATPEPCGSGPPAKGPFDPDAIRARTAAAHARPCRDSGRAE